MLRRLNCRLFILEKAVQNLPFFFIQLLLLLYSVVVFVCSTALVLQLPIEKKSSTHGLHWVLRVKMPTEESLAAALQEIFDSRPGDVQPCNAVLSVMKSLNWRSDYILLQRHYFHY